MGFHTFDVGGADRLEDAAARYRFLSREELLAALDPSPGDVVADLGSGTGFYTDDVAPHVGRLLAVDVQPGMHGYYREKGVPGNVDPVTAAISALPVPDGTFDGLFSTMTFHEFAGDGALAELARATRPGGHLVVADWSAAGSGAAGPPLDERYDATDAEAMVADHAFDVVSVARRPETFLLVAVRTTGKSATR